MIKWKFWKEEPRDESVCSYCGKLPTYYSEVFIKENIYGMDEYGYANEKWLLTEDSHSIRAHCKECARSWRMYKIKNIEQLRDLKKTKGETK